MSRHTIDNEQYEITIGWDPPLATFFLQVFRPVGHTWVGRGHKKPECMCCGTVRPQPLRLGELPIDKETCPAADPEQILWRGFGHALGDLLTLEDAQKLLEPYAPLTPEMQAALLQDQRWNV